MADYGFRFPVSGFRRRALEVRAGFAGGRLSLIEKLDTMEPCRIRGKAAAQLQQAATGRNPETGTRKP